MSHVRMLVSTLKNSGVEGELSTVGPEVIFGRVFAC